MPERTFIALFGANYVRVLRFVERRVFDTQTAEDVAADTFELAWAKIRNGVPIELPWLYKTASFKLRDHYKRGSRRRSAQEALECLAAEGPEGLSSLDRMALIEALRRLSERDREVVMLTYWEGLSATEVGQVLDISPNVVWVSLSRARTRLRTQLDAAEEVGADEARHAG